jgi:transglutaminase-like putative cysteine protease
VPRRGPRDLLLAAIVLLLLAALMLSAGVPARMLVPDRWDELAGGVVDGIAALPGTLVPYRGADEWVRRTLLLGGAALCAISVLQGFWPRRPGRLPGSPAAAAVSLGTLYAVPVISRSPERPFLSGALFSVLLCAFLLADRLRGTQLLPAALLVGVVTAAAALAAPALDRPAPWIDYERIADDVAARGMVGYRWDHSYRPIDWPRDGRELLRIRAQSQAYWKAGVLDGFDGRAWRRSDTINPFVEPDGDVAIGQPQWFQTIAVRVRGLRTAQFVTAGSARRVFDAPRRPVETGGGTFAVRRGVLRRGSEYRARVYTPRPTGAQLHRATGIPEISPRWLELTIPEPGARPGSTTPWATVRFPEYGSGEATSVTIFGTGIARVDGAEVLARTGLARIYELSRRLLAASDSPYDYLRRVRVRVQQGAVYSERPGRHAMPLDAFLFDDRRGYCQHFSGAMALLLRMGGVPARVAVGFSPGERGRNGEFVVRDFDAHSWVEAHFPRYGWVTFDPTPSASPAREQTADRRAALDRATSDPAGDRPGDPRFRGGSTAAVAEQGGGSWTWITAALLVVIAASAALYALLRRSRRPPGSGDPDLDELERALACSGRAPAPSTTLAEIERSLATSQQSRAYLRALSDRRYGAGGPRPSSSARAALRRDLAAGLGRLGWLRVWLALPPRLRRGQGSGGRAAG